VSLQQKLTLSTAFGKNGGITFWFSDPVLPFTAINVLLSAVVDPSLCEQNKSSLNHLRFTLRRA
jgi:hypothetical protein